MLLYTNTYKYPFIYISYSAILPYPFMTTGTTTNNPQSRYPKFSPSKQPILFFIFSSQVSDTTIMIIWKDLQVKISIRADEIDDKSLTGASGCCEGEMRDFFNPKFDQYILVIIKRYRLLGLLISHLHV